jgi:cytochrome P450
VNIAVKPQGVRESDAYILPLAELNPAQTDRFQDDTIWPVFERLRREDPVHFTPESEFGPYWSIVRWDDIMAVDTDHETFSSTEGIGLNTLEARKAFEKALGRSEEEDIAAAKRGEGSFIGIDEPYHAPKRKAVSPTLAPANLAKMSPIVRERAGEILDALPIGEPFDWVDKVSMELTAMTLATLFDFPMEQRRRLTTWSDMFMNEPGHGGVESWEQKIMSIFECRAVFQDLWKQRLDAEPGIDLISMLAHDPATRNMGYEEYQGNVVLLIVGGNDTTRNTISGSVYWLNKNPDQYAKLRADPNLVSSMVSETIRYQTPLAHMARVATRDVELGGKLIKTGDRVVMWYISGNRDEAVVDNPNAFIIDRARPRHHMSFGFGVHRCVGNRVAELQLTIIWEEILRRFPKIEVIGEPVRSYSPFVHGYESLQVVIPERA